MNRRIALVLMVTASLWGGVALGQKSAPEPRPAYTQQNVEAMKADVQRMRVLLTQMQNNLGNVGTTTMPLRHQFELEIEMWQVAIGDLDRRIAEAERSRKP